MSQASGINAELDERQTDHSHLKTFTETPAVQALAEVMDDLIDDFSVSSSSGYSSTDSVSEIWDRNDNLSQSNSLERITTNRDESYDVADDSKNTNATQIERPNAHLRIPSHRKFGKIVHKHELPRKIFHTSIGFITLWLYTQGYQVSQITPVLVAGLAVVGGADLLRFSNASFNEFYVKVMGFMMREKEISQINGVVYYLAGLIIVFLMFPKDICLLAVLLLSWADTAASTIGRAYGKYTFKITNSKSFAGSFAAFVAGSASTWLLYSFFIPAYGQNNPTGSIFWTPESSRISINTLVVTAGLITAASEAVDVCDDNFSIPILSAAFMYAFMWFNKLN